MHSKRKILVKKIKKGRELHRTSTPDDKKADEVGFLFSLLDMFTSYVQETSGNGMVMCPHCYNLTSVKHTHCHSVELKDEQYTTIFIPTVLNNYFICSNCNKDMFQDDDFYPIIILDEMIAEVIADLNKVGLFVSRACSGHPGLSDFGPYTAFNVASMTKEAEKFIINFFKHHDIYRIEDHRKKQGVYTVVYKKYRRKEYTVDHVISNIACLRRLVITFKEMSKHEKY